MQEQLRRQPPLNQPGILSPNTPNPQGLDCLSVQHRQINGVNEREIRLIDVHVQVLALVKVVIIGSGKMILHHL